MPSDRIILEGMQFYGYHGSNVEERTVNEVVDAMNAAQVACCPIMTAKDMTEDPHYQMRNVHIEWEDVQLGRKVKGTGICPKFSLTPGEISRGSVPVGYDNELVYTTLLDLAPSEVTQLQEQGII